MRDWTSGTGGLDVGGHHEGIDGGGAEVRLHLFRDLLAEALLDVGAQLGERVELARGARQLVVERRQHLLLQLLERHLDLRLRPVGELVLDVGRLARRHADERLLELLDHAVEPELDHEVALRVAVGADEVDDEGVSCLGRPALDRDELRDREAERLELLVDELGRHLGLGRGDLEALPVGNLDLRLHVDGGGEAEVLFCVLGQPVVVLGPGDRPNFRPGERVPEPAVDVAVDRLRVQTLLADPRDEHLHRHLPLAEPRHLRARGEVGGCVLDRVLDVVTRDVDRQANLVLGQLLDAHGHGGIVAVGTWATAEGISAGGGT